MKMFHNPRCSKSRATLELLNDKNANPDVILYLENPPSVSELTLIVKNLGIPAKDLIRFNETLAQEIGIHKNDSKSESEWIRLMVQYPILIERPIVFSENKAVIGRPPENVLKLV